MGQNESLIVPFQANFLVASATASPRTSQLPVKLPLPYESSQISLVSVNATFFATGEAWFMLDLSTATLGVLFNAIRTLRPSGCCAIECPWSGRCPDEVSFALENPLNPGNGTKHAETTLLRDLCWAQSENLTLKMMTTSP